MSTYPGFSGGNGDPSPTERVSPHLRSLLRYSWLVVLIMVASAAVAYELSKQQTKLYDATAAVLLTNAEPINVLTQSNGLPSGDPERDLNTDVSLVTLDANAQKVKQRLRLDWTRAKLLSEVRASLSGTSNVVAITARDAVPARAVKIADAFAEQYVLFRQQNAQAAYADAAKLANQQLQSLSPEAKRSSVGVALRTQLRTLETTGALQTGASRVVGVAQLPSRPAAPRPKFDAAVAGIAALLVGALLVMGLGVLTRPQPELQLAEKQIKDLHESRNGAAAPAGKKHAAIG
jgi:tyrosine-protein kinase